MHAMRRGLWLAVVLTGCGSSPGRDLPALEDPPGVTDAGVEPRADGAAPEPPRDAGAVEPGADGAAPETPSDAGEPGALACDVFIAGPRGLEDVADALWLRKNDLEEATQWFDVDLIARGVQRACEQGVDPKALTLEYLIQEWKRWVGILESGWVCADEAPDPYSLEQVARTLGVRDALALEFIETLAIDAEEVGRVIAATTTLSEGDDDFKRRLLESFFSDVEGSGGAVALDLGAFSRIEGVRVDRAWDSPGLRVLRLFIRQPYDHDGPFEPSFEQAVEVRLIDPDAPTVLGTGGYASPDYGESDALLRANRVGTAHRFYDRAPDDPDLWRFLTPEQAARDVHRVVERLQPLMPGPWISTGFSKGGSTALLHRRYFPNDVVGTIAFAAPLGFQDDPDRGLERIQSIDHDGCAERVRAEQRAILERFDELRTGRGEHFCFDQVSPERLFSAVAQYEWGFWTARRELDCDDITGADAPLEELLRELEASLWGRASSGGGGAGTRAWEYERLSTWGTPNLVSTDLLDPLNDLRESLGLDEEDEPAPWGDPPPFDPLPMQEAHDWVATEAQDVLLIYSEYDPWSAWSVELGQARRSLSVQIPEGLHWTSLDQATREDRDSIHAMLERWVDPEFIESALFELE